MKNLHLLFILLLISRISFSQQTEYSTGSPAQNLVPNPSFEDTVACPNDFNQVYKTSGWHSYRFSPDYFNVCSYSKNSMGVPQNIFGYQCASNGNAYCGLYSWGGLNYREFIGVKLTSSLMEGKTYYVSLKINLSDKSICATNKIGILFSTISFKDSLSSPAPIRNFAHIYSKTIVSDSINWTTIKGIFVADSSYQYLMIGNFFTDSNTDTMLFTNQSLCNAYYFIDDVCVSSDSPTCEISDVANICNPTANINNVELKKNNNVLIYPNPTQKSVHIKPTQNTQTIQIYDLLGILKKDYQIVSDDIIDLTGLSEGIYFIKIFTSTSIITQKLIITN